MEDKGKLYYEYLKENGFNTPDSYETFINTLSDPAKAESYYGYLKENGANTPDDFATFQKTLLGGAQQPAEQSDQANVAAATVDSPKGQKKNLFTRARDFLFGSGEEKAEDPQVEYTPEELDALAEEFGYKKLTEEKVGEFVDAAVDEAAGGNPTAFGSGVDALMSGIAAALDQAPEPIAIDSRPIGDFMDAADLDRQIGDYERRKKKYQAQEVLQKEGYFSKNMEAALKRQLLSNAKFRQALENQGLDPDETMREAFKNGIGPGMKYVGSLIAQQGPQVLGAIGAGAITKNPVTVGTILGSSAAGSDMLSKISEDQELTDEDLLTAWAKGALEGTAEALLSPAVSLGQKAVRNIGGRLGKELLKEGGKKGTKNVLANMLKAGAGEGGEEVFVELAGNLIDTLREVEPDWDVAEFIKANADKADVDALLETFVAGAGTGAGMGAIEAGTFNAATRGKRKEAELEEAVEEEKFKELVVDDEVRSITNKVVEANGGQVTDVDEAIDTYLKDKKGNVYNEQGEVVEAADPEVEELLDNQAAVEAALMAIQEDARSQETTAQEEGQEEEQEGDSQEGEGQLTKTEENAKEEVQEPVLEGVRTDRNQEEGGQESSELRTEEEAIAEADRINQEAGNEVVTDAAVDNYMDDAVDQMAEQALPEGTVEFTADNINEIEQLADEVDPDGKTDIRELPKLAATYRQILPDAKVYIHKTEDAAAEYVDKNYNGRGEQVRNTSGFAVNNEIHIIAPNASNTVSKHEFTHALVGGMMKNDPETFEQMRSEMEALPEFEQVREFTEQYDESERAEEGMVEFLARVGSGDITLSEPSRNRLIEFLNSILQKLGVTRPVDEGSFVAFAKDVADAMRTGRELDAAKLGATETQTTKESISETTEDSEGTETPDVKLQRTPGGFKDLIFDDLSDSQKEFVKDLRKNKLVGVRVVKEVPGGSDYQYDYGGLVLESSVDSQERMNEILLEIALKESEGENPELHKEIQDFISKNKDNPIAKLTTLSDRVIDFINKIIRRLAGGKTPYGNFSIATATVRDLRHLFNPNIRFVLSPNNEQRAKGRKVTSVGAVKVGDFESKHQVSAYHSLGAFTQGRYNPLDILDYHSDMLEANESEEISTYMSGRYQDTSVKHIRIIDTLSNQRGGGITYRMSSDSPIVAAYDSDAMSNMNASGDNSVRYPTKTSRSLRISGGADIDSENLSKYLPMDGMRNYGEFFIPIRRGAISEILIEPNEKAKEILYDARKIKEYIQKYESETNKDGKENLYKSLLDDFGYANFNESDIDAYFKITDSKQRDEVVNKFRELEQSMRQQASSIDMFPLYDENKIQRLTNANGREIKVSFVTPKGTHGFQEVRSSTFDPDNPVIKLQRAQTRQQLHQPFHMMAKNLRGQKKPKDIKKAVEGLDISDKKARKALAKVAATGKRKDLLKAMKEVNRVMAETHPKKRQVEFTKMTDAVDTALDFLLGDKKKKDARKAIERIDIGKIDSDRLRGKLRRYRNGKFSDRTHKDQMYHFIEEVNEFLEDPVRSEMTDVAAQAKLLAPNLKFSRQQTIAEKSMKSFVERADKDSTKSDRDIVKALMAVHDLNADEAITVFETTLKRRYMPSADAFTRAYYNVYGRATGFANGFRGIANLKIPKWMTKGDRPITFAEFIENTVMTKVDQYAPMENIRRKLQKEGYLSGDIRPDEEYRLIRGKLSAFTQAQQDKYGFVDSAKHDAKARYKGSYVKQAKDDGVTPEEMNRYLFFAHTTERLDRKADMAQKQRKEYEDLADNALDRITEINKEIRDLTDADVGKDSIKKLEKERSGLESDIRRWEKMLATGTKFKVDEHLGKDTNGELITREYAQEQVAKMNRRNPKIAEWATKYRREMMEEYHNILQEYGLVSEERLKALREGTSKDSDVVWNNYVPMKVRPEVYTNPEDPSAPDIDDPMSFGIYNLGLSGGEQYGMADRIDPIAQMMANLLAVKEMGLQNDAKKELAEMLKDSDNWKVVKSTKRVKLNEIGQVVGVEEFTDRERKEGIAFVEDGKVRYLAPANEAIKDSNLYKALKAGRIDGSQAGNAIKRVMFKIGNVYRPLITSLSLTFGLRQLPADIQEAIGGINTELDNEDGSFGGYIDRKKVQAKFIKNVTRSASFLLVEGSFNKVFTNRTGIKSDAFDVGAQWEEAQRYGMPMSWRMLNFKGDVGIKEIEAMFRESGNATVKDKANRFVDFISNANDALENTARLAAYMTAKEMGLPPNQAAVIGKNITINFENKGTKDTWLRAMYLFYGAAVNGARKNVKIMARMGAKGLGMYALGAAGLRMYQYAMMDDDEIDDLIQSEYQNRQRTIIPIPGTDKNINIKTPYSFHRITRGVGFGAVDYMYGKRTIGDAAFDVADGIFTIFDPVSGSASPTNVFPTYIAPLFATGIDVGGFEIPGINLDYAGRPIVNPILNATADKDVDKKKINTSKFMVALTEYMYDQTNGAMDFSPAYMEYLWDQYVNKPLIKEATGSIDEVPKLFGQDRFTEQLMDRFDIDYENKEIDNERLVPWMKAFYRPTEEEKQKLFNFLDMGDRKKPQGLTDEQYNYMIDSYEFIRKNQLISDQYTESVMRRFVERFSGEEMSFRGSDLQNKEAMRSPRVRKYVIAKKKTDPFAKAAKKQDVDSIIEKKTEK